MPNFKRIAGGPWKSPDDLTWNDPGVVFRELSFSRLECGVHDRLHIYPLCGIFYFPWHRHQIEGTNGFYCLIRKTERFTISNVESQVLNNTLAREVNPGCWRAKRASYHWTNCASSERLIESNLVMFKLTDINYHSIIPHQHT